MISSKNYQNVEAEFSGAMQKVHEILEKYPDTRDSDKLLWIAYLALHCNAKEMNKSPNPYQFFRELVLNPKTIQMATVIRCRAKIQNHFNLCLGTKVADRREREAEVRGIMGTGQSPRDDDYEESLYE